MFRSLRCCSRTSLDSSFAKAIKPGRRRVPAFQCHGSRHPHAAGTDHGFTFSMAVGRYDRRNTYEETEANAIGTEYLRADLLLSAVQRKYVLTYFVPSRPRQQCVYVDQSVYRATAERDVNLLSALHPVRSPQAPGLISVVPQSPIALAESLNPH
jgi:hypothetical protein